jgi:hypothetical protein
VEGLSFLFISKKVPERAIKDVFADNDKIAFLEF